ncbi:MAG: chemotaxis protein CheA [Pirellulaceae bacterium]
MSDPRSTAKNNLLDDMLGDFLDESDQHIAQLNKNLLQLDEWVQTLGADHHERCEENLLNEMFRAAHSLKGLSGMLGLNDINQLTHKIENVFDAARQDQLTFTRDVTDLIFMGVDQLVAMVELLKEPGGEPVDCDAVLEAIRRILQKAGAERKLGTQADAQRVFDVEPVGIQAPTTTAATETASETASAPPADPLEGLQDDANIPQKYLSMFVDEAEVSLEGLSSGLLALEGGHGIEALRRLLGIAHKVKGSAASVGLNRLAKLAHLMEDLLEDLVSSGGTLAAPVADVLLKCTDGLQHRIADLKSGVSRPDPLGPLAVALLAARAGTFGSRTTFVGHVTFQAGLTSATLKAQLICEKLAKLGELHECDPTVADLDRIDTLSCFRFRVTTDQSRETILGHVRLAGVTEACVDPLGAAPAQADSQPDKSSRAVTARGPVPTPTAATPEPNRSATGNDSAPADLDAAAASAPDNPRPSASATSAGAKPSGGTASQRATETIRVDTDRLDQLMDLAGQLVINRAQFTQIGDKLKTAIDCNQSTHALNKISSQLDKIGSRSALRIDSQHLAAELEVVRGQVRRIRNDLEPLRREVQTLNQARDCARELFEAIHQLDRVSDGIQKGVMDIRMVAVGPLFARFSRVVRDIARASSKEIRLDIVGEKTELDKRMIDELGDPLVHLVRNSADHGIESPAEREASGKPRQGVVTLEALHRGNSIVIEVRDDGKGLDTDRILRKALDKGLLTEADAQRMSPRQIQQLIWEPGLSTAQQVTDFSGRGMGMDIVKTKIEELSGAVDIWSVQGQGTTITLKLPLTLAILPSLMVDIAGDVFAMPMEAVVEIASLRGDQVATVHGHPMAIVRGRVIPFVRLHDVLAFHGLQTRDEASAAAAETTLVVVTDAGREIAMAVDRVIGEGDVVIKSIAENYKNVAGIAGASVRGDGRVALILDVPALIETISQRPTHAIR